MTIRMRNRSLFILFIVFSVTVLLQILFLIYSFASKTFTIPVFESTMPVKNSFSFFSTSPYIVISSSIFLSIYSAIVVMMIYKSFEKTQASEILFFALFLLSCSVDSLRLLIPLLHVHEVFSRFFNFTNSLVIFSRILSPVTLLFTAINIEFSDSESQQNQQNIEQIILITLGICLFTSTFIPQNSAIVKPNFEVSYGFSKTITAITIILNVISLSMIFYSNKKSEQNQKTTLGFIMIASGQFILFRTTMLFTFLLGGFCLVFGTYIFLRELHNQYIWNM